MKKRLLGLSIVTALSLVGCGSATTDENNSNESLDSITSISGNVVDGYLVGAKVCLDLDKNLLCSDDEPSAITTKNGKYLIENITKFQKDNFSVIATVTPDVIDEDDNKSVGKIYVLSSIRGENIVTPLTSLVQREVESEKITKDEAANMLAQKLSITDSTLLYTDYMKESSEEANLVHKVAKSIALMKSQLGYDLTSDSDYKKFSNEVINKYIDDRVYQYLENIKQQIVDGNSSEYVALNIVNSIDNAHTLGELTVLESNLLSDEKSLQYIQKGITELSDLAEDSHIDINRVYQYNHDTYIAKAIIINNSAHKECKVFIDESDIEYNDHYEHLDDAYSIIGAQQDPRDPNIYSIDNTENDKNASFTIGLTLAKDGGYIKFHANCATKETLTFTKPTLSPSAMFGSLVDGIDIEKTVVDSALLLDQSYALNPKFSNSSTKKRFLAIRFNGEFLKLEDQSKFNFNELADIALVHGNIVFYKHSDREEGLFVQFYSIPLPQGITKVQFSLGIYDEETKTLYYALSTLIND